MNEPLHLRGVLKLLRTFCPDHLYEELSGDLIQRFEKDARIFGIARAKRKMFWNAMRLFRPGIVFRSKRTIEFRHTYMIQNYFKIAIRSMIKDWVFPVINVTGLAVGIVAFVLILQYVNFETTFDEFHTGEHEIYRVVYRQVENGDEKNNSAMHFIGLRELLKDNFPEVGSFTGFSPIPSNLGFAFGYKDKTYLESGSFLRADSAFFKTFPSLLVRGDQSSVLADQHNLVISEKIAKKIFGDEDPIGKHFVDIADHARDGKDYMISGVMRDIPANSHFHADFVCPMERSWDTVSYHWESPSFYTYVAVRSGTNTANFSSRLNELLKGIEKDYPATRGAQALLQPIGDIHFDSHLHDELETNGNAYMVYILFSVGILVLVIAWINYINLETARFARMAREIGIRRIVGSSKGDLVMQLFIKYLCLTMAAVILAATTLLLVVPYFSEFTGVPVHNLSWTRIEFWLPAGLVFSAGSAVMGIYPVLTLLRVNPVSSVKGDFTIPGRTSFLRRPLAVVQFTASIVLLAFLFVVTQQLEFMQISNKKIDVDQVIVVKNALAYDDQSENKRFDDFYKLKNELESNSTVGFITSSSAIPGSRIGFTLVNEIKRKKGDPYNPVRYKLLFTDYDFIPLYGLKLIAGRNYVPKDVVDGFTSKLIFNESAIRHLGFASPEEAVGQIVQFPFWNEKNPGHEIIGVVEDYHHEAIKHSVEPTMFILNQDKFQQVFFSIRLNSGSDPRLAVSSIETAWKKIYADRPFNYFFLDDYYDQQFKSELYFSRIFGAFAGVAIFLACLGILGITLFEASTRAKEISIRKVLGGSVLHLVLLLSRDQIKVLFVSALASVPVIYYVSSEWLSTYPVRIDLKFSYFVVPLAFIFLLSSLVSGAQTIKGAHTNPVDHLKNE
jgi:putative ABC transport system permease protein